MNPHEMTDDELCRAVGVEVLGWHEGRETRQIGGSWGLATVRMPLALTGDDMLRVVEAMRADGYAFSCEQAHTSGFWYVRFGYMGRRTDAVDAEAKDMSLPRAVFEASLMAKRAQGGGE